MMDFGDPNKDFGLLFNKMKRPVQVIPIFFQQKDDGPVVFSSNGEIRCCVVASEKTIVC